MFNEIDEKNAENPLIDLSNATDDVLILILLRVPAKDLVKSCTKAISYPEFIKAARQLNNAWLSKFKNDYEMREILGTFIDEYVKDEANMGWWAGFSAELPRTNNAIESANKQLKARSTEWQKQPIRKFLATAADHMHISSIAPEFQVSKQWNRVLARNFFWRDKMEQDGYRLEWQKLAGLSTESFKTIAVRRAFGRNFIKDSWDLSFRDGRCLKLDPRWDASSIVWQTRDDTERAWARIEIPPVFLDGQPDMPAELGEPIEACLAIGGFIPVRKSIVIKLSDEGLTDEIMDNFRPTIVVSEMVGNRRDFISIYEMIFSLKMNDNPEQMNNEVQSVHAAFNLRFAQWRAEGWNKVEHVFKEYPPGMRYLQIQCSGTVFHFRQGHYGIKLANCSVKALCEKNAPE